MNDIDALYTAVCRQPLEDVPRLVYADALDERNSPGDAEHARFIRASIELSLLGSLRVTVENGILMPRGPDYYEMYANENDGDFEVGIRIDVSGEEINSINHKSKNRLYHGLLITKIIPDEDPEQAGSFTLALKRDEYSVPFPKKKHAQLTKECFDSVKKNWKEWLKDWDIGGSGKGKIQPRTYNGRFTLLNMGAQMHAGVHYPAWVFDRGFVSQTIITWHHWSEHADKIVKILPLTHVELLDAPEWDHDHTGVTIARQLLPWGYVTSPQFGVSYDDWVEERLPTFLSLRWPTIPQENWSLPLT